MIRLVLGEKSAFVVDRLLLKKDEVVLQAALQNPDKDVDALYFFDGQRRKLSRVRRRQAATSAVCWLSLQLHEPLVAIHKNFLPVCHVEEGRHDVALGESFRVHYICHFNLVLTDSFDFNCRFVLDSEEMPSNTVENSQ